MIRCAIFVNKYQRIYTPLSYFFMYITANTLLSPLICLSFFQSEQVFKQRKYVHSNIFSHWLRHRSARSKTHIENGPLSSLVGYVSHSNEWSVPVQGLLEVIFSCYQFVKHLFKINHDKIRQHNRDFEVVWTTNNISQKGNLPCKHAIIVQNSASIGPMLAASAQCRPRIAYYSIFNGKLCMYRFHSILNLYNLHEYVIP